MHASGTLKCYALKCYAYKWSTEMLASKCYAYKWTTRVLCTQVLYIQVQHLIQASKVQAKVALSMSKLSAS